MSKPSLISGTARMSPQLRAALGLPSTRTDVEIDGLERLLKEAFNQVPKIHGVVDMRDVAAFVVNAMKGNQR